MAEENYTSKFKVDISDLKKGITEANRTIKTATAEFKNATAGMDDWADSADGLSAKIKQQETVVEAEKKKLELLKEQLSRLNQNQEDGKNIISELTQKYESACETYGKTSDEAKAYAKQLTDAEAAQERNTKAAEELKLKIINQDTAVKNAEAQVSKYQSALESLQNHTETLTEKVQRQQTELNDLKQKYAYVAAEQGKESEEAKELANKISELSGELKENRTKLSEAEKAADDFDESLEDVGDSADETTSGGLSAFGKALENLAAKALTLVIDKLKEMVVQTGQVGMEFDSAMSQVAGTFGYTVEQLSDDTSEMSEAMQDLRDYSKEIATTTKFSATEVAEGMNYAAMAGWKSGEILEGYKGIVDLAAASGEELALTADIVTDGLTAMGYSASDASHFADVMAKTSANANTNVSIMGESFKYSATVAGLFGKEADGTNRKVENLALGLGLMANAGIKGSQSGNALKNSLSRLADPTDEQAIAMEQLGLAITEMKNVIDPEEVEEAQKAYEKAADTLQKAGSKVSDKTFDLQQKQLTYNTAVAKYGENSSQAQSAMLKLEQAETHLTDAQNAQLSAQNALEESQEALTLAQQGTMKAVATGETAFANADGSMKSLKEVYDALRSSMSAVNVELIDSEGNMRDADDIINELSQSEEGLTQAEQLRNASVLFGKQNLAGMLAIINASEEDYNKLTEAIYNSDGAAEDMADTMIDNLGGDLTILGSKLQAIQIEIYEKFEPALRKIAEKVGEVMDTILEKIDVVYPVIENAVNWVVDHGAELMATIAGVATAVGTFMLIINKQAIITAFTTGLSTITKAFGLLNTTMLANPVGLIVAAIAGLVVAFAVLWNKSDKFRNFWINLWESIKSTFSGFIDSIIIGWETISSFFSDAWDSFKVGWNSIIDSVKKIWNDFTDSIKVGWDSIKNGAVKTWDGIKNTFAHVADWFHDKFSTAWQKVKDIFSAGGEVFAGIKEGILSAFKNVVNGLIRGINTIIAIPFNAINDTLDRISTIDIAGFRPFENLVSRFTVPEIPQLAKGGIVSKPTIAQIGEAGSEAIIPLERNKAGLQMLSKLLAEEIKRNIAVSVGAYENTGTNVVNNSYNFTQNNTSPKALSRSEIYRQTKNLIRAVKRG